MNKLFFILMLIAAAAVAQTPDLERALMLVKMPYPHVDTLDRVATRLHYFDQNKPSQAQQQKLVEIYKAIANGYSVNYHFKQGYIAYEKYLLLKEKKLAGEKTEAIEKVKSEFDQKNNSDEAEVTTLQTRQGELNHDIDSLITKRNSFRKIFSAIIALLSILFAVSLFRSGVKIKNLRDETQINHNKLMQNHRISLLGSLAAGLKNTINHNIEEIKRLSRELIDRLPKDNPLTKAIKGKLEKLSQ